MDLAVKTFDQFRAELADAVTVAINTGKRISTMRCPLSVATRRHMPTFATAARAWGIPIRSAREFMDGFDNDTWPLSATRYTRLGRAYRARFVGTP